MRESPTKILVTGANPAVNTEITATVGAVNDGKVYHIKAIYIPLVTDANVANRIPEIQVTNASDVVIYANAASTAIVASSTVAVQGQRIASNFTSGTGDEIIVIPEKLIVPGGYKVKTVTTALQATDDYGAPVVFGSVFKSL